MPVASGTHAPDSCPIFRQQRACQWPVPSPHFWRTKTPQRASTRWPPQHHDEGEQRGPSSSCAQAKDPWPRTSSLSTRCSLGRYYVLFVIEGRATCRAPPRRRRQPQRPMGDPKSHATSVPSSSVRSGGKSAQRRLRFLPSTRSWHTKARKQKGARAPGRCPLWPARSRWWRAPLDQATLAL